MRYFTVLIAVAAVFLGCGDIADPVGEAVSSFSPTGVSAVTEIPDRAADDTPWLNMSAEDLWEYVAAHDSAVLVGIKSASMPRGIWYSTSLINQPERDGVRNVLAAIQGISILGADTLLPVIEAKITGPAVLRVLRALPTVDYVEPRVVELEPMTGCKWRHVDSGDLWKYPTTADGDRYHYRWSHNYNMLLDRAWKRASGAGVTIGVPDTGVSLSQEDLHSLFSSGRSTGRWVLHRYTHDYSVEGPCSHGTRVAGAITAPWNGQSVVGAAWGANLVTVRIGDDVYLFGVSAPAIYEGIRIAATETPHGPQSGTVPGRIVNISWGSEAYSSVSDEIRVWYAKERLFFGAAGSADWPGADVVFPAKLAEVVAVSAVTAAGGEIKYGRYGPSVEVASLEEQLGTGQSTSEISVLGLSSGAAATISGVAALIWSRDVTQSRDAIRQRLREAAHLYPNKNDVAGYGIVNAAKAVGALYKVSIAQELISGGGYAEPATYKLTAGTSGGDGPFRYYWSETGETTKSITVTTYPGDPAQAYTVYVTDQSDGVMLWATVTIDPPPGGCDPEIIC